MKDEKMKYEAVNDKDINEEIDEEKQYEESLKNSIYEKKKKFLTGKKLFVFVILVYVFFFSSNLIFNTPLNKATKLGEKIDYMDNRSYTLVSAIYDKEKKMMELVLDLENSSLDNVYDYYYTQTIRRGNVKKIKVNEIINTPLLTVIRLDNVPKRYTELEFIFAPKIRKFKNITDEITGVITLNKNNVTLGSIDESKTANDYLKERLQSRIKNLEEKLGKDLKQKEKYLDSIKASQKEKRYFEENKKYMSKDEIKTGEAKILEYDAEVKEINLSIKEVEKSIENKRKEINLLRDKLLKL